MSRRLPLAWLAVSGVTLGWLTLTWAWAPAHLTMPVDDAWYYLGIARRIVAGEGVTFDGFERTNGFQPLWLAVVTVVAGVVNGPEAQMRAVLTVGVLLAAAALVARPARTAGLVLSGLWLVPFHAGKVLLNGMESALVVLLLCLVATGRRAPVLVGLALLPLARMDLVGFVVVYGVCGLGWGLAEERGRALMGLAVPLAVLGLWFAVSEVAFGSPFPVSAAIKAGEVTRSGAVLAGGVLALGAVVGWWLRRVPLHAALAAQCAVVVAEGVARGLVPEIWHLSPVWLASLMVAEAAMARWRWTGAVATLAVLVVAGWSWQRRLDPASWSAYAAAQRTGEWVAANTPPDAVVAGWDVGIASAFSGRRVLQLEGLVNSWRYKREVLDRSRVEAYLRERGVAYLIQPVPASQVWSGRITKVERVDVSAWQLAHEEGYQFQGLLRGAPVRLIFVVLNQPRTGS